ncbi:MAG TPA: hypothetical protein PK919_02605 [Candidatus Aminicenantes bacterium]|nr:hypothetical protein [Candidatus Aminicenantes bacterium]
MAQRHLFNYYQNEIRCGRFWKLSDTGFRNFSQFEEDGMLLYIFAAIGANRKLFVDIGGNNGINSNCANLAINFGWHGIFIDGNARLVRKGRAFYARHDDTWQFPPRFVQAFVQRENINRLLEENGFSGEVDLLSIDLDGNDYWIWDALNAVQPRVVIIETHVEFGLQNIVVPYDKDYFFPGKHPCYHGASPVAMAKLAAQKGYRLVGANAYGFNTIYVKRGIGEDVLPEVNVESVLRHPRCLEASKSFAEIRDWEYLQP